MRKTSVRVPSLIWTLRADSELWAADPLRRDDPPAEGRVCTIRLRSESCQLLLEMFKTFVSAEKMLSRLSLMMTQCGLSAQLLEF